MGHTPNPAAMTAEVLNMQSVSTCCEKAHGNCGDRKKYKSKSHTNVNRK
jgi:hypothetical protein